MDTSQVGAARQHKDLLIGTWCIENRKPLLHNDSDFHPIARHLELIELPATA
jgi:predicted nucleic acid-binding protein